MITYVKVLVVFFTVMITHVKVFAFFFTLNTSYVQKSSIPLYNLTNRLYFFKTIICLRTMLNKNLSKSRIQIKITMS